MLRVEEIIRSILDTDFYKITMGQMVLNQYPQVRVVYQFTNRGKTPFPTGFARRLKSLVDQMGLLALTPDEYHFLQTRCGHYLKTAYLEFLRHYRFDPSEVRIKQVGGELSITIEGFWYRTIYWEVPLMALVSELFFLETDQKPKDGWVERTIQKGKNLFENNALFMEFGTRRRFSAAVQEEVLVQLIKHAGRIEDQGVLAGTSNTYLAMKYYLTPKGTVAHEVDMVMAKLFGYQSAIEMTLSSWVKEYQGDLGIALIDTFTSKVFFRYFNGYYARLFDGCRPDSGDPFAKLEEVTSHLQSLHLSPAAVKAKFLVPSDNLTDQKLVRINKACVGRIQCMGGIGTSLTNDVGVSPLNMVIKIAGVFVDGTLKPAIKLSDDPGKNMGDPKEIEVAKYLLGV